MTTWMTDIIQATDSGATFKARNDISKFSEQLGLRRLPIFRYDATLESLDALHARIDGITAGVKAGDTVYYQFPTYNGVQFEKTFMQHMHIRQVNLVAVLHDVEFLRFPSTTYFDEITYLNNFDVVIVHNYRMGTVLKEYGLKTNTVNLDIFDYSVNVQVPNRKKIEKKIIIAGSLNKSAYLKNWSYKIPIIAYGKQPSYPISNQVDYRGVLSPNQIVQKLPSGFGLVWDVNTSQYENSEEYAKYNNPHKVSLYIASGLPVIVKRGTAIAAIVQTYNLGIIIDSLDELEEKMHQLTKRQLAGIMIQVNHFKMLLTTGFYTKHAIMETEFQIAMGYPERSLFYE
ncbi:hypothetical protein GJV51_00455 [Leuconostoc mesenteroides subsp. mesenteroides]|nr:hypothetical protein GJV51_00455 [Leuconostoc mesenteroides subsp. mesenteroides]